VSPAVFVAVLALAGLVFAMGHQHARYLRARRGPVQDRQDPLYGPSAFHVLTFLRLAAGRDAFGALRRLRDEIETGGSGKLVYAGRVARVGLASSQLPPTEWDAVVLVQYPSRRAYASAAGRSVLRDSSSPFAETFSQGFDRPVLLNLAIPQLLLALRAFRIATGKPSHHPFVPAEPGRRDPRTLESKDGRASLDGLRELGERAVVIVNLLKHGTAEQRKADRRYGLAMAGLFAEDGHGPMHIGRAVAVEGDAAFDRVALVYYPGIDYLRELMGSTFFNGIVAGKQPGDTLAAPTVPVLARL
jgi:hypothetical protein